MLSFPNAKINLGLRITGRLLGGYHSIESCLFPIPWQDALEFVPEKKTNLYRSRRYFKSSGLPVEGKPEQNLVLKAYRLLKKEYPISELSIHLHKAIPMGAGLGGGSADTAFMLKMLNEYFRLSLDDSWLEGYAAKLGSDCPFFIQNTPALAKGTGTDLQTLDLDLSGLHLVILHPGIHISTREAYGGVVPKPSDQNLEALLLSKDFEKWRKVLVNDFEKSIFERYPLLSDLKSQLYKMGALYAAMSGSGSALFGLFESAVKIPKDLENYVCKQFVL